MSKKKDSSFIIQGSILAVAAIVSRVIGMLYRIPMTNIIGEYGNDYYSCAYEIYSMLLLISSYSLPMAVSKMVSTCMAKNEKQNALRVFRGAMLIAVCTGTAGCLFVFFGANFLTKVFQTPLSFLALRVLAPTLLVVAVLGVLRGFFQGLGTMIPSAISQIVEQIVNAVVSVGAAYILFGYGTRIASVLGSEQHYAEAYGAAGGTLGTGTGAFIALLFCGFVFAAYRKTFMRAIRREKKTRNVVPESYRSIIKVLFMTIFPILLSTTLYNLSGIINQGVFKNVAIAQGNSLDQVSSWWGIYSGYYSVLTQVPIAISTALATSCVPALAAAFARRDDEAVRNRIGLSMRFIMIVAMPCTIGMIVLANPLIQLLYPGTTELAGRLIMVGGISIVFYSISTLSNAVLQGIDRMRIPIRNALIALALNVVAIVIGVVIFRINIYAVIIARIVFSLAMCILNSVSVRKYSGYVPDVWKTFIKPAIAAVIMGVIVYFVYFVLYRATASNSISCIIAVFAGMISYFIVLLLIKGVTENELRSFPKGGVIIRLGKKLHLL